MTYRFEPGRIYRMPTHFGPAPGPRQLPAGVAGDRTKSPRRLSVAASFLTDEAMLQRHLPEGFALIGDPVVTVEFHYMTEIDWLAGRGYTMIHVSWPARFDGARDHAAGRFLAVVWESLADPIITGRDEIGHPKLYAEVDAPRQSEGGQVCTAGWMGFRFLELSVADLRAAPIAQAAASSDGTLMLKYVPRTGDWGEHELCQVTLTPAEDPDNSVGSRQLGHGAVSFRRAAWADLPTMYHVVNALAELPVIEPRGGRVQHSRGGKPYLDQKVLL
jgi:acetoacetate decarboxylase